MKDKKPSCLTCDSFASNNLCVCEDMKQVIVRGGGSFDVQEFHPPTPHVFACSNYLEKQGE